MLTSNFRCFPLLTIHTLKILFLPYWEKSWEEKVLVLSIFFSNFMKKFSQWWNSKSESFQMRPFLTLPLPNTPPSSDFVIFHQYLKVHKLIIRIDYLHYHHTAACCKPWSLPWKTAKCCTLTVFCSNVWTEVHKYMSFSKFLSIYTVHRLIIR